MVETASGETIALLLSEVVIFSELTSEFEISEFSTKIGSVVDSDCRLNPIESE